MLRPAVRAGAVRPPVSPSVSQPVSQSGSQPASPSVRHCHTPSMKHITHSTPSVGLLPSSSRADPRRLFSHAQVQADNGQYVHRLEPPLADFLPCEIDEQGEI
eukprot:scaffold118089_cov39-Phaeocystis_antarctica.AAC.1